MMITTSRLVAALVGATMLTSPLTAVASLPCHEQACMGPVAGPYETRGACERALGYLRPYLRGENRTARCEEREDGWYMVGIDDFTPWD